MTAAETSHGRANRMHRALSLAFGWGDDRMMLRMGCMLSLPYGQAIRNQTGFEAQEAGGR